MRVRHDANRRDAVDRRRDELVAEFTRQPAESAARERLRDELVTSYRPVARSIARRFENRGEPVDDLEQVAMVGLINALDRYQPDRGVSFLAYAVPTMTGELRRHFRDRSWSMRVPRQLKDAHVTIRSAVNELTQQNGRAPRPSEIAAHTGMPVHRVLDGLAAGASYRSESLDRPLNDDTDATLRDTVATDDGSLLELIDEREAVRPLIARLPERERTVLMLRFFEEMTQAAIADRLGMSQMHVSRLLSRTLRTLRDDLRDIT